MNIEFFVNISGLRGDIWNLTSNLDSIFFKLQKLRKNWSLCGNHWSNTEKNTSFLNQWFLTPCTFWALSQKLLQIKTWGWVWMIQNWFSHVPWVFWQCLKLILGHLGVFWLSNQRYSTKHKMFIFQQFLGFCKNSVFLLKVCLILN